MRGNRGTRDGTGQPLADWQLDMLREGLLDDPDSPMGKQNFGAKPAQPNDFERLLMQGETEERAPVHQFEEATPPRDKKDDKRASPVQIHKVSLTTVLDKLSYLNKVQSTHQGTEIAVITSVS